MPRLPTIRVIGSHAISTSWPGSDDLCDGSGMMVVIRLNFMNALRPKVRQPALPGAGRTRLEFCARMAPLRFFVNRAIGDVPQTTDDRSVQSRRRRRDPAARWLVHERHELVREAGHRAADADSADVRAATN